MIGNIQGSNDPPFRSHQFSQRRIDNVPPRIGQLDQNTTAIIGMIVPPDQSSLDEPVHAVSHCPRSNEGFSEQLSR
jgi:hypothetical protein